MKRSLHRILALSIKEFIQITRDPSSILIAFVMPLLLLIVYGAGLSLDAIDLKIGIAIEDPESQSQSLADSFKSSRFFQPTFTLHTEHLYPELVSGQLDGIFVIPFYFNRCLNHPYETAPLQLITDGSDPNTATFMRNYVEETVHRWSLLQQREAGLQPTPGITPDARIWYNEERDSHYFLVPGSIVIILTLVGTLLTSLVVAKEWEIGTMEALMATPLSMKEILLSKFFSYFAMGMGTLIALYVLSRLFFDIPFRGSFGLLLLVSCAYLSFALGTGILISTLSKNQFAATQASIIVSFLPAFMLSGFLFEISSMPLPLQWLSKLLPPKYYVQSLQTLFLTGNIYEILIPNIIILFGYALIILFFILKKAKKVLD